jgi:hypothetical protein
VINRLESAHYSSHFFAATLVSFWLTLCQAPAQTRETAFGQVRRTAVLGSFDQLTTGAGRDGDLKLYFWSRRGSILGSVELDSLGLPGAWRNQQLAAPIDEFVVVPSSADQRVVGVGIDKVERRLMFYSSFGPDTLRPASQVQLSVAPGRVVFGDLNNDRRQDFIVADREHPGAYPYFGLGNGKFRQGRPIAEDNALGELALAHLNNDSLIDIVCYDWIRSEVHLLYGIGQGKFLDQAGFSVGGDVQSISAMPLGPGGNLDLVIAYSHPSKIDVLEGDGLGGFKQGARLSLRETLNSLEVRDINHDGYRDLIGFDGSSVVNVFLNGGDNSFDDRIDFVGGRGGTQLVLSGEGRPWFPMAVTLDRSARNLVMLRSGRESARIVDSVDFASPLRPRGVVIADVDGDGANDVSLVSGGSNLLTVHLSDRAAGLYGPTGFALPAGASELKFHSFQDSAARFLISYPESRQVSVMSVDFREGTATNATIETERASEFLYWDGERSSLTNFFSFSSPTGSAGGLLTYFREIESNQFLERSFRLAPTSTLLAAGVGLVNGDRIPDVVFVSRSTTSGKTELAVSLGDSSFSFRQKTSINEVVEKNPGVNFVWISPAAKDGKADIVLFRGAARAVLERFVQSKENVFSKPDTIAVDLKIQDRSHLRWIDFDGDGTLDLLIRDAARGTIGWLRGLGNSFAAYRTLCSVPVRAFFDAGELTGDAVKDLAVVLTEQGVLRVYNGAALLNHATAQ